MNRIQKAILADIILPVPIKVDPQKHRQLKQLEIEELRRLVETYGGIVVERVVQQRRRPSAKTYLGTGKAVEVKKLVEELGADILIINGFLKPQQMENISKLFFDKRTNRASIHIWDRTDIILKIFEKHAVTQEAKLQVELARLKHDIPKVYQYQAKLFDRERGVIGGMTGAGEKGIEQEKRHIREQIKQVEKKLEQVRKTYVGQRKRRNRSGLKTIALVGYTNAGKSTLLRALTGKNVVIADELFSTLDTRLGSLWLPSSGRADGVGSGWSGGQKVLVADTIGFIQNLPPHLIESFKTTLSEVAEADLLLHVIDAEDQQMKMKISVVENVLREIESDGIRVIKVFNKTERLSQAKRRMLAKRGVVVSAVNKEGMENLKLEIRKYM